MNRTNLFPCLSVKLFNSWSHCTQLVLILSLLKCYLNRQIIQYAPCRIEAQLCCFAAAAARSRRRRDIVAAAAATAAAGRCSSSRSAIWLLQLQHALAMVRLKGANYYAVARGEHVAVRKKIIQYILFTSLPW